MFLGAVANGQTIAKSYHPNPEVGGDFINYGSLRVTGDASFEQVGERLRISNGVAEVEPSKFWDVVHKPAGNGRYNIFFKYGETRLCLGEFTVSDGNVTVEKLHYGSRVATSSWWGEGSTISTYNIGQYMALVAPTVQDNFPNCGQLVIEAIGDVSFELVTVVVADEGTCDSGQAVCIRKPVKWENALRRHESVVFLSNSFMPVWSRSFNVTQALKSSSYESDYVAVVLSLQASPNALGALNTNTIIYGVVSDYTLGQVLQGYRFGNRETFGSLLREIVESKSNWACNIN